MIHRLSIRLFEADFVSGTVVPNWTIGATVKAMKCEFKKRYIRQEFESDFPFSVKFVGRTLAGTNVNMEFHSEVVEDHVISKYTAGDDSDAYDPYENSEVGIFEGYGDCDNTKQETADPQQHLEDSIFGSTLEEHSEVFDWKEYDSSTPVSEVSPQDFVKSILMVEARRKFDLEHPNATNEEVEAATEKFRNLIFG